MYRAIFGLVEEIMVFCPVGFDSWMATESNRLREGYHYRDLHVKIGSEPTDKQKAAAKKLMGLSDFTTGKPPRATRWLSDFLVLTMIHESTHGEAFTGPGKTLSKSSTFPFSYQFQEWLAVSKQTSVCLTSKISRCSVQRLADR